jgi:hypothetical protein
MDTESGDMGAYLYPFTFFTTLVLVLKALKKECQISRFLNVYRKEW